MRAIKDGFGARVVRCATVSALIGAKSDQSYSAPPGHDLISEIFGDALGRAHGVSTPRSGRGLGRRPSGVARGAKPRTLLAALLLDEGRVVPAERLVAVLWGEDPPDTARAVLQTYVSSLRRSFDRAGLPSVIVSHRVGYLADIPAETLDRAVFERLVADGRKAAVEGRHHKASEALRAALALWRGPALGGISDSRSSPRPDGWTSCG
ncbi:BTAD domain-containing putative transcriptional regulator [Streptosporangium lutulentum]